MLRLDLQTKKFMSLPRSRMNQLGLLERDDLQRMIRQSPTAFFEEIDDDLRLIGEEVRPVSFVDDRIDLLAVDRAGQTVIIELKRGADKLQLLQALAYAGMVSSWDAARVITEYAALTGTNASAAEQELLEYIDEDTSLNSAQRILLIAEEFDFEVLVTAEWLTEKYGVDIRCYRLSLSTENDAHFLSCMCIYPPSEITDWARRKRGSGPTEPKWKNWESALKQIENPAVSDFFRKELEARRDASLLKRALRFKINGRRRWNVEARQKDAYVWQSGRFEGDVRFWTDNLGQEAEIQPVKNGNCLRFYLRTSDNFAKFSEAVKTLNSVQFIDDAESSNDQTSDE
jgi:hypothetical protein